MATKKPAKKAPKKAAKKTAAKGGARKAAGASGPGMSANVVTGGEGTRRRSAALARMATRDGAKGTRGVIKVSGSRGQVYSFKTGKNAKTGRISVVGGDNA